MFCADLSHILFPEKFYSPLLGLVNNCQKKMGLEAVEKTVTKNVKTLSLRSGLIPNNILVN